MNTPERSLAKCKDFDFGIHDRGYGLSGNFEYEDGGCQGIGYLTDVSSILGLLQAVGVDSIQELEGKSCWVTHTHCKIIKIEPLHKKNGKPFVIKKWQEWIERYNCNGYTLGNIMDLTHPMEHSVKQ
jgi:hypothetical protein